MVLVLKRFRVSPSASEGKLGKKSVGECQKIWSWREGEGGGKIQWDMTLHDRFVEPNKRRDYVVLINKKLF